MKALLARPHDFVVDDMRRWLTGLGLEPVRRSTLAELEQHAPAGVRALVISMAVTSSVTVSVADALAAARRRFASTPLLLAGLSSVTSARAGLDAELRAHGLSLHGAGEQAAWGHAAGGAVHPGRRPVAGPERGAHRHGEAAPAAGLISAWRSRGRTGAPSPTRCWPARARG